MPVQQRTPAQSSCGLGGTWRCHLPMEGMHAPQCRSHGHLTPPTCCRRVLWTTPAGRTAVMLRTTSASWTVRVARALMRWPLTGLRWPESRLPGRLAQAQGHGQCTRTPHNDVGTPRGEQNSQRGGGDGL